MALMLFVRGPKTPRGVASSPGPVLLKLRGEKQGLVDTARVKARMR